MSHKDRLAAAVEAWEAFRDSRMAYTCETRSERLLTDIEDARYELYYGEPRSLRIERHCADTYHKAIERLKRFEASQRFKKYVARRNALASAVRAARDDYLAELESAVSS